VETQPLVASKAAQANNHETREKHEKEKRRSGSCFRAFRVFCGFSLPLNAKATSHLICSFRVAWLSLLRHANVPFAKSGTIRADGNIGRVKVLK
jgi:hypothetical protein